MKRIDLIKWLIVFVTMTASSFFQTLILKGNIGVCACWDAVNMNMNEITGIKIGTWSIIFNMICILVQIIILRRNFPPIKFLQLVTGVWIGAMVNLFYYHVVTFEVDSYCMRIAFVITGFAGMACSTGMLTSLELVTFPPEGMCQVIAEKGRISFGILRTSIDVLCILSSLALSFVFGLSLKIREGTVIGMVILGPLMGRMIRLYRSNKFLNRYTGKKIQPGLCELLHVRWTVEIIKNC